MGLPRALSRIGSTDPKVPPPPSLPSSFLILCLPLFLLPWQVNARAIPDGRHLQALQDPGGTFAETSSITASVPTVDEAGNRNAVVRVAVTAESPFLGSFLENYATGSSSAAAPDPLAYHGGPTKSEPYQVHLLFYGPWSDDARFSVINFIESIPDTGALDSQVPTVHQWWHIMDKLKDSEGRPATDQVSVGTILLHDTNYTADISGFADNYKKDAILGLVEAAIDSGEFPLDPNGVYIVLTSADVQLPGGFCKYYCGYHDYAAYYATAADNSTSSVPIAYAIIGNPMACPTQCAGPTVRQSDNAGDMAAAVLGHELAEMATDFRLDAWYTKRRGLEVGDLCTWMFVEHPDDNTTTPGPLGSFNMVGKNGYQYLVQLLPDLDRQKCVLQGA